MAPPKQCNTLGFYAAFDTEKELITHKIRSADHWYCKKCNEDCETEEEMLIHKIETPTRHICCPICGMDFKSSGGRDGHITRVCMLFNIFSSH